MLVYAKIIVSDVLIYSTIYVWPTEKRKNSETTTETVQVTEEGLSQVMSGSQRECITKLGGIPAFTHSFTAMASL